MAENPANKKPTAREAGSSSAAGSPVPFVTSPVQAKPAPSQSVTASALSALSTVALSETITVELQPDHAPAAVEADLKAEPVAVMAAVPDVAPAVPIPATPPVQPVAAIMPAPSNEGSKFMATAFEATKPTTERLQAMFGQANEGTKVALQKGAKLAVELTELTKGNAEALVASSRVAAQGAGTLTQDAADYGKKSLNSATGALRSFAAVKSPVELIQLQSEYAKSSFDAAIAQSSKLTEAWVKLAGDMFQPLSNRFAVAAEKMKSPSL